MTDSSPAPVRRLGADDHVRGPERAPVVVFYGDFACPRCALAWERLAGAPVRLAFRHFALKAKHERAVPLARAAQAAAVQDRFWAFADALYADPGRTDDPHLWAHARSLGLELDRFETDRRSDEVAARVTRDVREAIRAGVTVTPTLFGPDGAMQPGPPDVARVREWAQSDQIETNTQTRAG